MSEMAPPNARIPVLDGLRGIAIALVLLYHFNFVFDLTYGRESGWFIDGVITTFSGAGWAGVDLFFVLSGFLITGILVDSKTAARRYFGSFYVRRVLRIFPAYYGFVLLLFLLLPLFDEPDAKGALQDYWLWYATYMTNILDAIDPGLRADFLFDGHIWSLAVEEQFYLLWPAFVFFFRQRTLMRICAAGIVCALALRISFEFTDVPTGVGYTLMPARMDTLAAGAIVALALREPRAWAAVRRWAPVLAVGLGVLVAIYGLADGGFSPVDPLVRTTGFTVIALLFAALLALALGLSPSARVPTLLAHPVLRWLGRYSYATYLVHLPVAVVLSRKVEFADAIPAMAGSTFPAQVVFSLAAAGLSLSVAWLSWQLWERHFLKLKERFPYARRGSLESAGSRPLS